LIYESIWSHYLKLFLGHAAYAQTLVLAIFMGGMALGAWLVSRFTLRIRNLLLGYAAAELGIGILAILFHRIFAATTGWAVDSVFPAMGGLAPSGTGFEMAAIDVVKWTIASALILPASLLLGTTFPLMSAGVIRLYPQAGGRALAMLYFTNSLGAAFGVLASGFVLIARVGLPGTILTAGLMNVLLAIAVWALVRGRPAEVATERAIAHAEAGASPWLARAVVLLAFATGAASFIYEITWIRMLTTGLGASTHAFEVMLAAFILGMAGGAFVLRGRIERIVHDIPWLAAIVFAKAILAVYAVWIYGDVLEFIRWMLQATARTDAGYVLVNGAGLVASMIVMFPTAFCAGMTLPLATHALTRRGHGEAAIGRIYGANTAGCIVGAIFATHIGMEALGLKNLTGLGALVDVAVAFTVLAAGLAGEVRKRALALSGALVVAASIGFATIHLDLLRMSSGVFRFGYFEDPRASSVLYYRDGKTASISVIEHPDKKRSIRTNGKTDAAIAFDPSGRAGNDEGTMILAAALPFSMKPDAQLVANIGFGSGLTTHALLGSPRVREVDTIEIERMMVEGARLFHPRNARAYEDPRSRIHIDDAKTFFASRGRRYDFIVSEPSNPWVSGVSTLFSQEFYRHVRRYLKDDGLLVQWIQSYDIGVDLLATIFKALDAEYKDYVVYRVGAVDLLIIASPERPVPAIGIGVFGLPGIAADLERLGFRDADDLRALRVAGRRALAPVFSASERPANSDYFPILDQHAPRARFRGDSARELRASRDELVPALELLDVPARTTLAKATAASGVNRPVRTYQALAGAEAIGILLGGSAQAARFLGREDRAAAVLAHALRARCSGAEAEWVDALTHVIAVSSPYLARDDVKPAFDAIRAWGCWATLSDVPRRRIELLEAFNDRDPARISTHAAALLQSPLDSDAVRKTALQAAIAAELALGRPDAARAFWSRYGTSLSDEAREGFLWRLLVSHLVRRS
jgi:spermidine synthase